MQAWSKCAQESIGNTEIKTLKSLEHFSFKVRYSVVLEAESRAESIILFMTDWSLTASWDNPVKGTGGSFNRGNVWAKIYYS